MKTPSRGSSSCDVLDATDTVAEVVERLRDALAPVVAALQEIR